MQKKDEPGNCLKRQFKTFGHYVWSPVWKQIRTISYNLRDRTRQTERRMQYNTQCGFLVRWPFHITDHMVILHQWPHGHSRLLTTWSFHINDHMVIPHHSPHGHTTWLFYTSNHMAIPHQWPHGYTTWSFYTTDHMVIPHGYSTPVTTWSFHVTHHRVPSPVSASVSVRGQLSVGHGSGWTVSASCRWAPPGDHRPQRAPASCPSPRNLFSGICTSARLSNQSKSRRQTVIWKKWHIYVYSQHIFTYIAFSALTLLVGQQEGIRRVKNMAGW